MSSKLLLLVLMIGCLPLYAMDDQSSTDQATQEQTSSDADTSSQTTEQSSDQTEQSAAPQEQPSLDAGMTQPSEQQSNEEKEAVPAQPEKPKEETITYGEGVDTLDVESGGNWLKKRIIWEDAQAKYEKIKSALARIFDSRMEFFVRRSETDKQLNMFFIDIGFAQGELEETVQALLELIELDRQEQGSLSAQERDIREQLVQKKNELEQLKADAKSISDLDIALDDSIAQVLNQINLAVNYEKQAWKKFKDIGQELNDKKAKEDYLYMDAMHKNIDDIAHYISGPLLEYAHTVLSKTSEYMSSIKEKLSDIKNSGIELKQKLSELEQAKLAKKEQEDKRTQERVVKKKPKTWVDSISFIWTYPIAFVKGIWDFVFGLFGK